MVPGAGSGSDWRERCGVIRGAVRAMIRCRRICPTMAGDSGGMEFGSFSAFRIVLNFFILTRYALAHAFFTGGYPNPIPEYFQKLGRRGKCGVTGTVASFGFFH